THKSWRARAALRSYCTGPVSAQSWFNPGSIVAQPGSILADNAQWGVATLFGGRGAIGLPSGRCPALDHGQHLLGKELQTTLGHGEGRAAEAKGHVHFEIAEELSAHFEPAQDLVGRTPARRLHEAIDCTFEPALAGDLGLLLVGIVALDRLEVLAQELVVMEVALDELALVFARFLFGLGQVGAAHAELRQHHRRRLAAVVPAEQLSTPLHD